MAASTLAFFLIFFCYFVFKSFYLTELCTWVGKLGTDNSFSIKTRFLSFIQVNIFQLRLNRSKTCFIQILKLFIDVPTRRSCGSWIRSSPSGTSFGIIPSGQSSKFFFGWDSSYFSFSSSTHCQDTLSNECSGLEG